MRVLQVINSIAPARGGPTYVVLRLARALAARGVEVELLSTRAGLDGEGDRAGDRAGDGAGGGDGEAQARRLLPPEVPLTLVPVAGPPRLELAPGWLKAALPRVRRADLVHVHTVWTYPVAVTPLLCRAARTPYLVRPAGTLDEACIEQRSARQKRLALALLCRGNLERAAAVHVTSEHERRELEKLVPEARLRVLPVGVDLDPQPPVADAGGPGRRIGFLGRLHEKKGIEPLLGALARLPDIELELAGRGEPGYEATLRERARTLGVEPRTRWLGHLDGADKRAFLARVDALAFPSRDENFGVAVAEAMAAGRAVVVSPGVALAEELTRADAGLVCPAEPAALADALGLLLHNGAMRARLAAAGERLVRERFGWERVIDRTVALYRELLAR